ncbi:MAG: type II secretion system protein M [Gemmatimonadaceae bacterium]|nr:type II secretion system protein M [Gemmatimonadaceae bacterium]
MIHANAVDPTVNPRRGSRTLRGGLPLLVVLMVVRLFGTAEWLVAPATAVTEGQSAKVASARALLRDSSSVLSASRATARAAATLHRERIPGTSMQASEALVQRVSDAALENNLDLLAVSTLDPRRVKNTVPVTEIGVQVDARGSLEAVSSWLLACEGNAPHLRIRSLSLHREGSGDPGTVRVSARVFALRAATSYASRAGL